MGADDTSRVTIRMDDGSTISYPFRSFQAAQDFAERAVHIHGVVQVNLNGMYLLDSFLADRDL